MLSTVRRLFLGGMLGKVMGIFRELLAAWLFGTGMVASAYRLSQAAFLIPLHGFVSDAVNAGFTPNFTIAYKQDSDFANQLFSSMHFVMLLISLAVGGGLIIFADLWVSLLAPGFDGATLELSISLVRILGLSMPAYALVSLYASVDLAISGGRITAARASIQSIGLIFGTVSAFIFKKPELIAVGFVLAYYFLMAWGISIVRSAGLNFVPEFKNGRLKIKAALLTVWKPFKVLIWVPIFLQLNQIIERRAASVIDVGAVAAIDYARFISETLVILVAMPFAVAGLSHMASMSQDEFKEEALRGFKVLCLVGIPVASFFSLHSVAFVELVFMRGSFDQHSVALTGAILSAAAPGIAFQLIGYSGSRFLSGRHRNSEVLFATCLGIAANIAVNTAFSRDHGPQVLGWGMSANALLFSAILLFRTGLLKQLMRFLGFLFLGVVLYAVGSHFLTSWLNSSIGVCVSSGFYWLAVVAIWRPYRHELLALRR